MYYLIYLGNIPYLPYLSTLYLGKYATDPGEILHTLRPTHTLFVGLVSAHWLVSDMRYGLIRSTVYEFILRFLRFAQNQDATLEYRRCVSNEPGLSSTL